MKKWLIGMACVGLLATAAMGQSVVINEFRNDAPDAIELVVVTDGLNMQGMILKDYSSSGANDGGGAFTFSSNSLWAAVPAGTIIVLQKTNTATDVTVGGGDYNLAVGLQNTTYFTAGSNTFDVSTEEIVQIKASGSGQGGSTGAIHSFATAGAGAQYTSAPTPKLKASTGNTAFSNSVVANSATAALTDFNGTDATGGNTTGTIGTFNNANNQTFIEGLRGPATFGVTFDQSSGFTVEEGTSEVITATAANGTAPYGFTWSSTLGASHYTTNAGVFTILATAPIGGYTSTVVAADSAAQSVTNSIEFSVVAPVVKYAIAIVTNAPENGTVTTTPATEAAAGTAVTVTATPAGGYAVQSIVVNGGAVAVSNGVFTMPAELATVTVTFGAVTAEGIVDFRFNAAPHLQVTVKDSNLSVSDMVLSSGTIETNITTGAYFTDEPYIEETAGWGVDNQAGAKAFSFTITPAVGASLTINAISFKAYATSAGPSAYGFDVGGGMATYAVDAPSASLLVVSQAVAGVVGQTGAIVVKIQGWANGSRTTAGTGVFRLDDVVVHGTVSTGPAEFGVTFNKTSGFTVEQGSSDAITATAANGTAPYGYTWSSTLGSSYYTTNAGVFTILATAPVGGYTSTVVAADSAAQSVTNRIGFSVTAPAPKYAITIVTNSPANGTVTTTPATESAAGAAVTVNATPAGGYAVESIVVNGGAVTVVGNAFTMPAEPATVTVTFMVYEAPDALITFETATLPASYATNSATLEDGKVWSTMRVVRGNTAGSDRMIGTNSARIYPVTGTNAVLQQTQAYAEPITQMSFWAGSYGSDNMANVTLTAEVSADGTNWEAVKTLTGAAEITSNLTEHVIATIPANAVYARFVATAAAASGKRVNVDNVAFDFGVPVLGVTVDKTSGFTVNQGSSDVITATAANGTAPYGYSWTSTLGSSYRTTNGNQFAILSTAPTGSYSATVTATDAVLATAQKTVTFSVVGVNPSDPTVLISGSLSGTVGVEMALTVTITNETANDWYIDLKDPDGLDDFSYGFAPPAFTLTPTKTGTYVLTATADTGSGTYSNRVNLTVTGGGSNHWAIGQTGDGGTMSTTRSNLMIVLPTNYTLNAVYGSEASGAGLNSLGQGSGALNSVTDYSWNPATRTVTIFNTVTNRRFFRIGATP